VSRLARTAAVVGLAVTGLTCPGRPKEVVYDLAARVAVADRWAASDVVLFGTPGAQPRLTDGFHREGAAGGAEPFLWSKGEAEVALRWEHPEARIAILDAAPYDGVSSQSVEVRLNGTAVERFRMNDVRHRYRIPLPAGPQQAGENRLRFVFAASGSPADADPESGDRRRLAAAFYSLVVGAVSDTTIEDLLARGAPRPFGVEEEGGIPRINLLGPAALRFALRLPEAAELRFTPDLATAARAAAGAASFRVLFERADGQERELRSLVVDSRSSPPGEQVVPLPGEPGEIVRVGLAVAPAKSPRFAWGQVIAPRVMGRGGADPLHLEPFSAADEARADALREGLDDVNVVLVILDAARASQLGVYGYERPTTPEIDRIAAEAVVFDRAYTPAVYTLAAMSSVWTSQYPDRHHADLSFSARLPDDRLTLAELLGDRGIRTAGFTANAMSGVGFGLDRGFQEFQELFRTLGSDADVFRQVLPPWLAENRDRRFFAYVHFREPHFPYDPPAPFDTRFGPGGPILEPTRRDFQFFKDVNQGRRAFTEAEREHLVRLYDGNLAFADQEVGGLREALEAEGLWDRTVFILAADHGEELYEHGFIGHNVHVFEPSVRIPLIIRFPTGVGPAGQRVGALVDLLDLAPTIADILGLRDDGDAVRAFQGRSLLPVVAGAPGRAAVLSRTVWDRPRYGLRHERFKLIYDSRTGEEWLFDLEADPNESRDVASEQPLRTAFLRQALHGWTRQLGDGGLDGGEAAQLSPEQCENLKVLGYLESGCP
jgi:arylsulfatase A-like enzyme